MTNFSTPWISYVRPKPQAATRLFCFPYAGGTAAAFNTWSDHLPDVEVCPIQLPGRENRLREKPYTDMEPLTQAIAQAIKPYLDKPFAFFGHSMGANICFELSHYLRQQNGPLPIHLFVSGCCPPQVDAQIPAMHHLSEKEFIAELRQLKGTPERVLQNPELMRLLLPLMRADFALHELYVYTEKEPLSCPITAFGGLDDGRASRHYLTAWQELTYAEFMLQMFPGDHFFLHSAQAPMLKTISQKIASVPSTEANFF